MDRHEIKLKNRNNLIKLFDDDDDWCVTNYALMEMTPASEARAIAERIGSHFNEDRVITGLECSAGVGGNTIAFIRQGFHMTSVEKDKETVNCLRENTYLARQKYPNTLEPEIIESSILNLMHGNDEKYDFIFADPPWGGARYREIHHLRLYYDQKDIEQLIRESVGRCELFVLKCPMNVDPAYLQPLGFAHVAPLRLISKTGRPAYQLIFYSNRRIKSKILEPIRRESLRYTDMEYEIVEAFEDSDITKKNLSFTKEAGKEAGATVAISSAPQVDLHHKTHQVYHMPMRVPRAIEQFKPIDWLAPYTIKEFHRRCMLEVNRPTMFPIIGERHLTYVYHISTELSIAEAIVCAVSIRLVGSPYAIVCAHADSLLRMICDGSDIPKEAQSVYEITEPTVILRSIDYVFRANDPNFINVGPRAITKRTSKLAYQDVGNQIANIIWRSNELNCLLQTESGRPFQHVVQYILGQDFVCRTPPVALCPVCQELEKPADHFVFSEFATVICPTIALLETPAEFAPQKDLICERSTFNSSASMARSASPYAFVTLLMINDQYMPGCLTLAHTLRKHKTRADLVCMVTDEVSAEAKKALELIYDKVVLIDKVVSPDYNINQLYLEWNAEYPDPHSAITKIVKKNIEKYNWLNQSFTKWECLKFVEYKKILFIDADMLPMRNIDDLFELQAPAGLFPSAVSAASHQGFTRTWGRSFQPTEHGKQISRAEHYIRLLTTLIVGASLVILEPNVEKHKLFRTIVAADTKAKAAVRKRTAALGLASKEREIITRYFHDGRFGNPLVANGADEQIISLTEFLWGSEWTSISKTYAYTEKHNMSCTAECRVFGMRWQEVAIFDYIYGKPWEYTPKEWADTLIWWSLAKDCMQHWPMGQWFDANTLSKFNRLVVEQTTKLCAYCVLTNKIRVAANQKAISPEHKLLDEQGQIVCPTLREASKKICGTSDKPCGMDGQCGKQGAAAANIISTAMSQPSSTATIYMDYHTYSQRTAELFTPYDWYHPITRQRYAELMAERYIVHDERIRQEKCTRYAYILNYVDLALTMITALTLQLTNTKYPVYIDVRGSRLSRDRIALLETVADLCITSTDDANSLTFLTAYYVRRPTLFLRNVDHLFELCTPAIISGSVEHGEQLGGLPNDTEIKSNNCLVPRGAAMSTFSVWHAISPRYTARIDDQINEHLSSHSAPFALLINTSHEPMRKLVEMALNTMFNSSELNIIYSGFRDAAQKIIGRRGLKYDAQPCVLCGDNGHPLFSKNLTVKCVNVRRAQIPSYHQQCNSVARSLESAAEEKPIKSSSRKAPRFAYVTLLMVDDQYMPGCLTLAHAFRRLKTTADLVCMVTDEVSAEAKKALELIYDKVIEVPKVVVTFASTDAHYATLNKPTVIERRPTYLNMISRLTSKYTWMGQSCTKWECLKLVEYEKIIFIDADMLPISNIDHLFELPAPAGIFGQNSYRDILYSYGKKHLVKPHGTKLTREECFDHFATAGFTAIAALVLIEPSIEKHALLMEMLAVDKKAVARQITKHALNPTLLDVYFDKNFGNRLCISGSDEQAITVLEYLCGAQWTQIDPRYLFRFSKMDEFFSDVRQAYGQIDDRPVLARCGEAQVIDFMIGKPWRAVPDEYLDYLIWWAESLCVVAKKPELTKYYDEEKLEYSRRVLRGAQRSVLLETCDYCKLMGAEQITYDWGPRDYSHQSIAWYEDQAEYELKCPNLSAPDVLRQVINMVDDSQAVEINDKEDILEISGGQETQADQLYAIQPIVTPNHMAIEYTVSAVTVIEIIATILAAVIVAVIWLITSMFCNTINSNYFHTNRYNKLSNPSIK